MASSDFPHIVIAGIARTPIGLKCSALSGFSAEYLGSLAACEAMSRAGVNRGDIDAVVGANVYQFTAPGAQDIYFPRNIALRCELDVDTPSLMVQRICGSGIQTLITGFQQIAVPDCVDDTQVVLCAAAETMSRAPQILRSPRVSGPSFWEFVEGGTVEDSILASLNHTLGGTAMMLTADEYGSRMGVTRQECDEFTVISQERARAAGRQSFLNGGDALKGMFALDAVDHDGRAVCLAHDECVRETSLETLAKLPGFTPNKLVSPGNASEIADGGAAAVIASRERAEALGLPTRWQIVGFGVSGVEPQVMGRGPVPSIGVALQRAGLKQSDIGLWEINEAFAAQYLGVEKELKLPREIVNVNGGAIAIGHPLAATGLRLIADLVYEMDRRGERYGCVSACIGGGQGAAMIVQDTTKR
ncbi:3-ketoacyl-CoA thiolase @ Acetyl-CoA acetyltransferase [hydrothermal vent metagenome]|uniref:3-ketoacyl-CoA thiolase @ Acetyl-CoA acetyltransferase n=1 Tax=hydrothermal vent metagenome TaxID=652676 RepID=A0A3B1DVP4_9ZZZZ